MRIGQKAIVSSSPKLKDQKREGLERRCSEVQILSFRERRCAFSLDFRPFEPSVLDGARSKVVLRSEGYMWTPI